MEENKTMKNIFIKRTLSPLLIFSLVYTPSYSIMAKASDRKAEEKNRTDNASASESEEVNHRPPKDEGPYRAPEDYIKEQARLQTQLLIQRSLLLATEEIVSAERYQVQINEQVSTLLKNYSLYILTPKKVKELTSSFQAELVKDIYQSSLQDLLNRSHDITTANVALWSKDLSKSKAALFPREYSLYDMVKPTIEQFFKKHIYRNRTAKENLFNRPARLNARFESTVLKMLGQEIAKSIDVAAEWHFTTGKASPRKSQKPRRWDSPVEEGKELVGANHRSDTEANEKGKVNSFRAARRESVVIDLKSTPGANPNWFGKIKGVESVGVMDLEIPSVDVNEVLSQNPETLRYHLRHPVAGAQYFGTQFLIFNIPLIFVTLGMVSLDSTTQPMAMDNLINSFSDPATYLGFGAFILGSHYATRGFMNVVKNPNLRILANPLGLAAGFMASRVFGEFWEDKNIKECARSLYDPQLKDSIACSKGWNEWMVSDKMSQYMPGIMSLIGTAVAAGLAQEFGGMAIKQARKSVQEAEVGLKEAKKSAAKGLAEDLEGPAKKIKENVSQNKFYQKAQENLGRIKAKVADAGETLARQTGYKKRIEAAEQKLRMAKNLLNIKLESARSFKEAFGSSIENFKGKLRFRVSGVTALSEEVLRHRVLTSESLGFFGKARKLLFSLSPQGLVGMGLFLAVEPLVGPGIEEEFTDLDSTHFNFSEWLGVINPFEGLTEAATVAITGLTPQLPHEKHFKTLSDIYEAYKTSLDAYIKKGFQGSDLLSCYKADSSSSNFSHLVTAAQNNWKDHPLTGVFSESSRDCVVKSDFTPWLEKYSAIQRLKRKTKLKKVEELAGQWGVAIANFTTSYNETFELYRDTVEAIHHYKVKKAMHDPNAQFATEFPELLNLDGFRNTVAERSKVPLRANRDEDQSRQFETLHPDFVGNIVTPEFADYLLVSMACGPSVDDEVSLKQKLSSLSWLPWGDHIAPQSPLFQTTSGFQFHFIPPRVTNKMGPKSLCGGGGDPRRMVKLDDRQTEGKTNLQVLMEFVAENVRADIINRPLANEADKGSSAESSRGSVILGKADVTQKEGTFVGGLVLNTTGDNFINWFNAKAAKPYVLDENGVIPSINKNYHKKMKELLYPILQTKELFLSLDYLSNSTRLKGLPEDELVVPDGVFDMAVMEFHTYIRTLRTLGLKVLETKTLASDEKDALKIFMTSEFDKLARLFLYSVINANTAPTGTLIKNGQLLDSKNKNNSGLLFQYGPAKDKLSQIRESLASTLPIDSSEGLGAFYAGSAVLDKMEAVLNELEGYKTLATLTQDGMARSVAPDAYQKGNQGSPLFKR